jgi:hypothetical protein
MLGELNKVYQDCWAIKLSWYKLICGTNGKMKMLRCKDLHGHWGEGKVDGAKIEFLNKAFKP